MNHKKSLEQSLAGFGALPRALWIVVLVSIILFSFQGIVYAQSEKGKNYTITLKSRTFTPQPGIKPLLRDNLIIQLERGEKRHVYLQLKKHFNAEERVTLEKQGVRLLNYIGSYTWYATVTDRRALEFTSPAAIKRTPILGTIRWIGEIKPVDRINPSVLTEGVAPHSRGTGDTIYVLVSFHSDVGLDEARSLIEQIGGQVIGEIRIINTIQISGPERMIRQLIDYDAVQWVDQLPPKGEDDNDGLRGAINVDVVWIAPYNLDGTNVTIGQWETRNPDATHDDFGARVRIGDLPASISNHATHVCGTLLGDGSRSAAEGGAANQWRGVATNSNSISFRRPMVEVSPGEYALDIAELTNQYTTALAPPYNIAISTNSWGTGHYHKDDHYDAGCQLYDQIIRGALGRTILIVASAGNQGPAKSGTNWTTVRIPNSAKNTIEVGNIFSDRDEISWSSSTGPTEDGRLKPDVVAPGDQADDDPANPWGTGEKIRSCYSGNTYGEKSGTSMSTPAVSGAIALMLQQYRLTYWGDVNSNEVPLPSTYKSILCHTATDITEDPQYHPGVNFVGPDYIYGYGRINAQASVDVIRDVRFREGVILSVNDEDIYTFEVAPAEDELKVTLAWDDVTANPGDVLANILKNDLDLILINPVGDEFYPPWELDPTNPATPAVRNSYPSEADADTHRDNVNVVEQVVIENPDSGIWTIKVKASDLPEPYQRYSIIAGDQPTDQLEGKIDIMQVLDRSGSMGGYASDTSTDRKIEVLKFAADQFIQMMKPDVGNQLGLVQFNQDVVPFDATHEADLAELTTVRAALLRGTTVPSIEHGGSTSIGDGLQEALNQLTSPLADPDHDHVILLVSDGKENTASWIAGVQDDIIDNNIAVCPLGLGYGSGINEAKLTDLAEATGGTYRITSDDLIFRKFFIEILAGAVKWEVIVDPIGELAAGGSVDIPVTITSDQDGATFTAYWGDIDNAIDLKLITPSGTEITATTNNNQIRYGEHSRYAFYQLDFPLSGSLTSEWAGEWKMRLTRTQILETETVRYSASAFAEGGTKFDVAFDRLSHLTGDKVLVKARLTKGGLPVIGAEINVSCNVPIVGAGNILHEGKVSHDELDKYLIIDGDTISLIDRKLQILAERAGKDILERGMADFKLYDDGQHNDGKANDGVYANSFTDTKIAGSYTFHFIASGIPAVGNQMTTREWTKSFYNEVNINPEYSIVDVKLLESTADGWRYNVTVVPRDQFGNYLGPGHPVSVTIAYTDGSRQVTLDDNIDGTYTKEIFITQNEIKAGAKLEVDVDGKRFTTVEQLPTYGKWSVSFHSGTAIPTGSFSNNYDPDFSIGLDFDYHFTPQFSVLGLLGYNHFDSGSPSVSDTYWWNISANLKYEFTTNPLRPYINGGPGIYIPESGSTKPGFNAGLGLDYSLTSDWIIELGADYHHVFTSGSDTQFFVPHIGLIYRF